MKASTFVLAGLAVGTGVFAALQIDHRLNSRADSGPSGDLLPLTVDSSRDSSRFVAATPESAGPSDFRLAAQKANPSVVSVDRYNRVQRDFFDNVGTTQETGSGSGVILSANGTIVTNNHVVEGATEVKVRLSDKRVFAAKVLGRDPRSDLAVLKIDAPNLKPIELGQSKDVEVGQWVLAVGNPLGFDNTVSVGVVSSLKRNLPVGSQGLVDAIQTDAAINPGNSGGALTDAQGRLIGINSAIASRTGQSVGIGFAIPVDRVKTVVNDIVKLGRPRYADLGVRYSRYLLIDPVNQQFFAERLGVSEVPDHGFIITQANRDAEAVGIRQYSVLLEIDGEKLETSFDLNKALLPKKPGDSVLVKFWNEGKVQTSKVKLQEILGQ